MSKLLRYYKTGQIYFVTSITHNRKPLIHCNYEIFLEIIKKLETLLKFELIAYVILPDHFHLIIDPKTNNLSDIMKRIKIKFAYQYRLRNYMYRKTIWQRRFWDHIIRDQTDLNNHINYIHFNPVKHLNLKSAFDWKYSSIHRYKELGFYQDDWRLKDELRFEGNFGE